MRITTILSLFIVGAIANPLAVRDFGGDDDDHNNDDVRGFDITGVLTEIDLTFPEVKNKCDCIQECLNRPTLCANYVFKFASAEAVAFGHRNCTLCREADLSRPFLHFIVDSDFVLPSDVQLVVDLGASVNINADEVTANGNNPHIGSLVPQAFKDPDSNKVPDNDAVSGYVLLR
ncbi:hypothetical protein FGG08_001113 [Glutinoglossum americanum]|uniref:Uncharacterized protein n=1 Tax=Glutinoglossum americanum TaxID=1670608 RepID=A0A9P8IE25_9PEZI|nr:hypothetical protein FGG08_001113 [Glutinoglossum americanum]